MTNLVLIGIIAALYVLGVRLGNGLADIIDSALESQNEELNTEGRLLLTWAWPVGAFISLFRSGEDDASN